MPFPGIESLYRAPIEEVEEMLRHLGLYRQRAQHLKEQAKVVVERFGGKILDR
jgi:endonuclease-3